jgi:hypothetical protein
MANFHTYPTVVFLSVTSNIVASASMQKSWYAEVYGGKKKEVNELNPDQLLWASITGKLLFFYIAIKFQGHPPPGKSKNLLKKIFYFKAIYIHLNQWVWPITECVEDNNMKNKLSKPPILIFSRCLQTRFILTTHSTGPL